MEIFKIKVWFTALVSDSIEIAGEHLGMTLLYTTWIVNRVPPPPYIIASRHQY